MKNQNMWVPTLVKATLKGPKIIKQNISFRSILVAKIGLPKYVKAIKEHANGSLLDLGCGNVPYYDIYKECVTDVYCTDWDNSLHMNIHLDVVSDLNQGISFSDNMFDTILFTDVLEHLKNPGRILEEISRVMKADGTLIMAIPFMYSIHEEPHDYARYTRYGLESMCKEAGLKIESIEEVGGALTIIGDTLGKIVPFRFLSVLIQSSFIVFIGTKLGEFIENRTKRIMPKSYILIVKNKLK